MNKNNHLPSLSQQLSQDNFCHLDTKDIWNYKFSNSWLPVCTYHCCTLNTGSHLHKEPQFHTTGFSGLSLSTTWETEEKHTATKIIFRNYWWKPESLMVNYLPSLALGKPKTICRLSCMQKEHIDKLPGGTRNQSMPTEHNKQHMTTERKNSSKSLLGLSRVYHYIQTHIAKM